MSARRQALAAELEAVVAGAARMAEVILGEPLFPHNAYTELAGALADVILRRAGHEDAGEVEGGGAGGAGDGGGGAVVGVEVDPH